ncbi:arsenic resistance N-acetyltransferase ArsN2 [Natronorarus salvus]|uniref:arsenic resistance N-acetyltransferase ArsN2 n=1 Tax=Natronorarus salvus TaxID=3117733 RepID=UPI002F267965
MISLSRSRGDRRTVERLLSEAGLPTEDLDGGVETFVAERDGEVVGCGGLERRGTGVLVRSVAVAPEARGEGNGTAICRALFGEAARGGAEELFLLTTDAAGFFERLGFERVDRESVPKGIGETRQFASLCPESATCMHRGVDEIDRLRGDPGVLSHRERIDLDPAEFADVDQAVESGVDRWVGGLVRSSDGATLLVRNGWSDGWVIPGGKVETGESLREAVDREVREETGVSVGEPEPVALVEQTFTDGEREVEGWFVVFAAEARSESLAVEPGIGDETIHEVRWFDQLPEELEHRSVIERALPATL